MLFSREKIESVVRCESCQMLAGLVAVGGWVGADQKHEHKMPDC